MKIAVLGTGMVGQEIAAKLINKGYEVMMGSRTVVNEKAKNWVAAMGANAYNGTFEDAANFAETMIFNCTKGEFVFVVLKAVGQKAMEDKILIDISNPLDFSEGMPPTLKICNHTSQGEQLQELFPKTKVVKTLNTMNCYLMLNPKKLVGNHSVFISGNSDSSKKQVKKLLNTFGWEYENMIDLGDITTARGTEMLLPIWLRIYGALGTLDFNFHIQK